MIQTIKRARDVAKICCIKSFELPKTTIKTTNEIKLNVAHLTILKRYPILFLIDIAYQALKMFRIEAASHKQVRPSLWLICEYTTLNKFPYQLACQDLELEENRWLGLIRMASKFFPKQ